MARLGIPHPIAAVPPNYLSHKPILVNFHQVTLQHFELVRRNIIWQSMACSCSEGARNRANMISFVNCRMKLLSIKGPLRVQLLVWGKQYQENFMRKITLEKRNLVSVPAQLASFAPISKSMVCFSRGLRYAVGNPMRTKRRDTGTDDSDNISW